MTEHLLTIGISQLMRYRDTIKSEGFEGDRDVFFNSLANFTDAFASKNIHGLTPSEYQQLQSDVEIIADWMKMLPDDKRFKEEFKTLYLFLERLARFWVPSYDDYILLIASGNYGFGNYGATNTNKIAISKLETRYTTTLEKIPVYLCIPDYMRTDILLGVALIHEIGHFYDFDKGLKKAVYDSFTDGIKDGAINPNDYIKYFPNGLRQ